MMLADIDSPVKQSVIIYIISKPNLKEERKLWKKGCLYVLGVDEVGRGSFAGPVIAGAVVFGKKTSYRLLTNSVLSHINDSKLLSPKKREKLEKEIKNEALLHAVSVIGVTTINRLGIGKASQMAVRKVVKTILEQIPKQIKEKPQIFVLADGFPARYIRGVGLINQKAIIKGDQKSVSIAAASIIAKVYRDRLMKKLHNKYPGYELAKNKGYGTKEHREALKNYGLSKIHRKSFNLQKFL
ncbi:MAG: ribonuclease HII [Patescibacteria group bacterium]|nr:ribonuclease HII [Patescibacteria group bacterium]